MNWLAHILLAGPDPADQIGGLLPDLIPHPLRLTVPAAYRPGMEQHQAVDAFTDSHPLVRAGLERFAPPYRRFAGVLTDVFYDHFLTRDWASHSDVPLARFTATFHAALPAHRAHLPSEAYARLMHLQEADVLNSYGTAEGIRTTLERISGRLRRPFDLTLAMPVFEREYDAFAADFRAFFPALRAHAQAQVLVGRT